MKFTIVTPNYNGERFLSQTIESVLAQRSEQITVEYIIVDGGSTDRSIDIINAYKAQIDHIIVEADDGPASAINKGLERASGDVVAWLNSDDCYHPGTLMRVAEAFATHQQCALAFGSCRIINEYGKEIRQAITRFKELFFPFSSRFAIQSINYISQPAMFFSRQALNLAGPLKTDMKAAWDYDFILRLWKHGGAKRIKGRPLADFRWHASSISGQTFKIQFAEEYHAAVADAGRFSPQALLHAGVRAGIVGIYALMARSRMPETTQQQHAE